MEREYVDKTLRIAINPISIINLPKAVFIEIPLIFSPRELISINLSVNQWSILINVSYLNLNKVISGNHTRMLLFPSNYGVTIA